MYKGLGERLIHSCDTIEVYFISCCLLINTRVRIWILNGMKDRFINFKVICFAQRVQRLEVIFVTPVRSQLLCHLNKFLWSWRWLANMEVKQRRVSSLGILPERDRAREKVSSRPCLSSSVLFNHCSLLEFSSRHLLLILGLFFLLCHS